MKQPNIIMIFCDELRTDSLSCYSKITDEIETPNIDKISTNGVSFDNCFCASPVCVPSRTSIMTGLLPEESGVYHNEAMFPEFHMPNVETLTTVLEAHNYQTVNFGKTHLANGLHGFMIDDSEGAQQNFSQEISDRISPKGKFKSTIGGIDMSPDYLPDKVTDNALNWLKNNSEKDPYFLRISYLQPHTPIIVKKEFANHYDRDNFKLPKFSEDELKGLSEFEQRFSEIIELNTLDDKEIAKMRMYYYALVAWIDQQVGRIIDYLEERNQLDETIIIFSSDHGANKGEFGSLGKQIFHYNSHAIPLIISYPPKIEKGVRSEHLTSTIDFAPIIFSLAGIKEIPDQFKGIDTLENDQEYVYATIGFGEKESRAFPLKNYGQYKNKRGWPRRSCIRSKTYRLDMNTWIDGHAPTNEEERDVFFVDVAASPMENVNMKDENQYQEIVDSLQKKLTNHLSEMKLADPHDMTRIYSKIQKRVEKL